MSNWFETPERPGYKCKIITHGNATVKVFRPICTEAQAAQNEQKARVALEGAMREYYKRAALRA